MASEMKLSYFNVRARAEKVRLLFKLAGKNFIDNRIEGDEWKKFKPLTPKGQMPVLEVDGKMICESHAIARFVARELNLYGANNWEAAICDMIYDTAVAALDPASTYRFSAKTEEAKAEAMKKLETAYESLEKLVVMHKKGTYILGENASIADNCIYSVTEFIQLGIAEFKLDQYPAVAAIVKSYSEIPAIAEWLKTRPQTRM